MPELVQIVGAMMVLAGYVLTQFRILEQRSYPFLALNLVGSAILAIIAFETWQLGFLVLEGVWALVSLWSLVNRLLDHRPASAL